MDLSLLPAAAAAAPPVSAPSSPATVSPDDEFDALLDRASAAEAGVPELDDAPIVVVAPVVEWLPEVVIQTPGISAGPSDDAAGLIEASADGARSGAAAEPQPSAQPGSAGLPSSADTSQPFDSLDGSLPAETRAARGSEAPVTHQDAALVRDGADAGAPRARDSAQPEAPAAASPSDAGRPGNAATPGAQASVAPTADPSRTPREHASAPTHAGTADRAAADAALAQALSVQSPTPGSMPAMPAPPAMPGTSGTSGTSVTSVTPTVLRQPGEAAPPHLSQTASAAIDVEAPAEAADAPDPSLVKHALEAFARAERDGGGRNAEHDGGERGASEDRPSPPAPGPTRPGEAIVVGGVLMPAAGVPVPSATDATLAGRANTSVPDLTPQFVRTMHMQWRDGIGQARLELQPEHLGKVTVDLQVGPDGVDATLTAESAVVRGWIEAHESDLKNGLAGQGLTLASLTVTADPHEQRRRQPQREAPPRKDGRAADTPSESWQGILGAEIDRA